MHLNPQRHAKFDLSVSSSSANVSKLYLYFLTFIIALAVSQTASAFETPTPTTLPSNNVSREESSSSNDNYAYTNCPSVCKCIYEPSILQLKISCRNFDADKSEELVSKKTDHQPVTQLTITDTLLNGFTISKIYEIIQKNKIQTLSIHQSTLDPLNFLTSDIFQALAGSLKSVNFVKISTSTGSKPFSLPRGVKPKYFSELKLDNLNAHDCDGRLSQWILKSLPSVHHINIVNSQVDYLTSEYFSHLSELRSLNLSHNRIPTIPYFTVEFPNLRLLDFSHNAVEHLQEEVFIGLGQLHILKVNRNKIHYVDRDVFSPLKAVEFIDLSHNAVIQIFEPYFQENKNLKVLLMSDSWSWDSFVDQYKGSRSFTEMERLLATLTAAETLDISDNEMITIPETLTHAPNLKRVSLKGNPWKCSCEDRWVDDWIRSTSVSITEEDGLSTLFCHSKLNNEDVQPQPFSSFMARLNCLNTNINARTPIKYYGHVAGNTILKCHPQRHDSPNITWTTPSKRSIIYDFDDNNTPFLVDSNLVVLKDGSLLVSNISTADFGLYLCVASYPDLNVTHFVHLGMDTSSFMQVKLVSILVGILTSFCFLFTVLIIQLIRALLEKCGVDCFASSGSSKTRRVKAFFESIEQNNTSQLDWLRDNYNMQAKRIKDNCVSQLERIRESYTSQTKNLSDIKYYGAQQLHTIRDQYFDQIRRVSTYSGQHLCKVRENYVFQRNRVSKFSSHQLLRLRETYKWQAHTLNKILENLPKTLPSFDTCRGMGACGRTDSMYLDEIGEFKPLDGMLESASFSNTRYGNGSSDKMEHVSLLIPPRQMQRFGESFGLPPNLEAAELVLVVTKASLDTRPNSGAINESVIVEEEEEDEKDEEEAIGTDIAGGGDAKC